MPIKKLGSMQCEKSEVVVSETRDFIILKLPRQVSEYLKLKDKDKVYWTPIDGTIQISTLENLTSIPIISMESSGFLDQPKEDNA